MKTFKLFILLSFLPTGLLAQFNLPDTPDHKLSFSAGIGVSSQFTTNFSPYFRIGSEYYISPKIQLYGSASHTRKSEGDTFSILVETFYYDGNIIGSASYQSSIRTFNMFDFGLGIRYLPYKRVAIRIAPGLTQLTKAKDEIIVKSIGVRTGRTTQSANTYSINQLETINSTLFGVDLGVDIVLTKWLSLNYCSYLRTTDVAQDDIYGVRKDRIMQSTLSLNYTLR
jgi:hypothetical protein